MKLCLETRVRLGEPVMTVFHHVSLESIVLLVEIFVFVRQSKNKIYKNKNWIEWPSGLASSISLTEVRHVCVRSGAGWVAFQMNSHNNSLLRPSEGTLN